MTKLRVMFAIVLLGLWLQLAFTLVVQEPYPAIIYPPFGTVHDKGDYFEFESCQVTFEYDDGETQLISKFRLLQDIPKSSVTDAVTTIREKEQASVKQKQIQLGGHTYEVRRYLTVSPHLRAEMIDWLARKAVVLTDRKPQQITFDFFKMKLFKDETPFREHKELLDSVTLGLTDAAPAE